MASFFGEKVKDDNTNNALGATVDHVRASMQTRYGIEGIQWNTNDEETFEMEPGRIEDITMIFDGGKPDVNWDDGNKENFNEIKKYWKIGHPNTSDDTTTTVTLICI